MAGKRKRLRVKLNSLKIHARAWAAFVAYEVMLAESLLNKSGHPLDYVLHYLLYIWLFYFFCYYILLPYIKDVFTDWLNGGYTVLIIFIFFFFSNLIIYKFLVSLKIETIWSDDLKTAMMTNVYRFTFVLFGSTMHWYHIDRERKTKKMFRMHHSKAIANADRERLHADNLQKEVDLHKARISPHFIYNAMNVIFNEVRKKNPTAAERVLSLTDFLRYSISSADGDQRVALWDEVEYIKNYISLSTAGRSAYVHVEVSGEEHQHSIIPFMIATLVENVISHGDLSDPEHPAYVAVLARPDLIRIRTENKIRSEAEAGNGIGIDNLKHRLKYFYPGAHSYRTEICDDRYHVELTINLNQ